MNTLAEPSRQARAPHRLRTTLIVLAGLAVLTAVLLYAFWAQAVPMVATAINYYRSWSAPAGTLSTETAPGYRGAAVVAAGAGPAAASARDWPSYNRTLTSERYSPLSQIDSGNAAKLKVLCSYDTGQRSSFQSGLIEVQGALIGTTEFDIFSIDPNDCRENWRTHEDYKSASQLTVNRGAAYLDGMLYRGTEDGRVLAYDFKTGKRIWEVSIANPAMGETTPAAPIAWNGLVFIGNAGGDNKGVKGRMYALDAKTGKIVWEFYLVPKGKDDVGRGPQAASPLDGSTWKNEEDTPITGGATWTSYTLDAQRGLLYVPGGNPAPDFASAPRGGENLYSGSVVVLDARTGAYKTHYKLLPKDWHDWDVSAAPAIVHTRGGRSLLSVAPKDGHLYGFDIASGQRLYRTPVTRIENADAHFEPGKAVHFCPGSQGGAEWNGPAYDPRTNFVLIGQVDWCATVVQQSERKIAAVRAGKPWSAMDSLNPYDVFGDFDPPETWAGWVYAADADTGEWKWRVKSNYPVMSGMTPTAGGIALFGDMGGNFYALDSASGKKLWGAKIGGAIGGGVITYEAGGAQRIAVATGMTSIIWPTEVVDAKVVVLGLADAAR